MAITLRTAGTWAVLTANGAVTLPTHQAGDMLIVRVAAKSSNAATETITIGTTGWTKIGQGNNGTTNSSNGGGSVLVAAFFKVAESSSETNPTVSFSAGPSPAAVVGMAYQKDAGEMWIGPQGNSGPDTTSNTAVSATIASLVRVYSGDVVDFFTGVADDTTMTVPTITQTGVTFDTVTESPAAALLSTTGNDISADGGYRTATAGTATAAAVVTGTLSTAETNTSWMTVLRVMTPPPTGQAQAKIKGSPRNHGQALATIKGISRNYGQARAWIKSHDVTRSGQARAQVPASIYAFNDDFNRSVSGSAGTATSGTDWSTVIGGAADVNVDGSKLVITNTLGEALTSLRQKRAGYLQGAEINAQFSIPSFGTTIGNASIYFHTSEGGNGFPTSSTGGTFTVNLSTGAATVGIVHFGGTAGIVSIGSYVAGDLWNIKAHTISNAVDTRVKVKAWKDGTTEPGWQYIHDTNTDDDTKFWPGISFSRATSNTTVSITVDNINYFAAYDTVSAQAQALIVKSAGYGQAAARITENNRTQVRRSDWAQRSSLGGSVSVDIWAPDPDSVLVAMVAMDLPNTITSVTGGGRTWIQAQSLVFNNVGTDIWIQTSTTDASDIDTILVDWAGDNDNAAVEIFEVTNADKTYFREFEMSDTGATVEFDWTALNLPQTVVGIGVAIIDNDTGTFDTTPDIEGKMFNATMAVTTRATVYTIVDAMGITALEVLEYSGTPEDWATGSIFLKQRPMAFAQAQAEIASSAKSVHGQAQARIRKFTGTEAHDTFTRSVASNSWGTADTGGDWAIIKDGGVWEYSVDGSEATIELTAESSTDTKIALPDVGSLTGITYGEMQLTVTALDVLDTSFDTEYGLFVHTTNDSNNNYGNGIFIEMFYPDIIRIRTRGGLTNTSSYNLTTLHNLHFAVGDTYNIKVHVNASQLYRPSRDIRIRAKLWKDGDPEPGWLVSVDFGVNSDATRSLEKPAVINGVIHETDDLQTTKIDNLHIYDIGWSEYGQAQAQIKQTYSAVGQAQALIVVNDIEAFGQAQAYIKVMDIEAFGQAQSQIKQTYRAFGQAQGQIKNTYRAFGQAQAWLENTYNGLGQAQALIKNTYRTFGQAQAHIKATPNRFAQAQGRVGKEGALTYFRDTFTRTLSNDAGTPDYGEYYSDTFEGSIEIDGSKLILTTDPIEDVGWVLLRTGVAARNVEVSYDFMLPTLTEDIVYYEFSIQLRNAGQYIRGSVGYTEPGTDYIQLVVNPSGGGFVGPVLDIPSISQNTWYTLKVKAENNIAALKFWERDNPEPTDWTTALYLDAGSENNVPIEYNAYIYQEIDSTDIADVSYLDNLLVTEVLNLGYGQAQADIKQTYRAFGQAQAEIAVPAAEQYTHGQAQAQIKQTYFVHGQAQAWIENTYVSYGQAQAQIKQTYRAYGQSQAWIENTYAAHGQAQAQIKQTYYAHAQAMACVKGNAFAQAQAWIETTYNQHGQAQANIKQTYRAFAQANAWIEQTSNAHGQSQAQIKNTYYGLGQAQADIKQTYVVHAQAQAQIKNTYYGHGQAQAWIEQTYFGLGQAQGSIKQVYYAHGQVQGQVKQVYYAHGQAQADIKQTYYAHAQAQALIKNTYFAHGQANAWIEQTYYGLGQAQGQIKQTYYQHGQAQAQIKQVYFAHAQAQAQIKQTYLVHAQAQAWIENTYFAHAQAQAKINAYGVNQHAQAQASIRFDGNAASGQAQARILAFGYPQWGQAQGSIKQTYRVHAQAQANIEQTYNVHGQAQGWIENTYYGLGQAQADIKQTYYSHGQANAYIIRVDQNVHGQAAAWIENTYYAVAQAQAKINAYGVVQHGQAQAYIIAGKTAFGQSQAYIKAIGINVHGQAQGWIETTYNQHGQAQGNIKQTYRAYAQANAWIEQTSFASGQAQALIKNTYVAHGQSQAQIKNTYVAHAQAQARIKNTYRAHGQANALIGTLNFAHGQAQGTIKTTYNQHGQAQGNIKQTYHTHAQAQGLIKDTYESHGQAQAYIILLRVGHGQAQATIENTYSQHAQAQAAIRNTYNAHANAQGTIKVSVNVYGQAQGWIETSYNQHGQAMALITSGTAGYGQAQALIKQTYLVSGQAEAVISKSAGYGQAQALIRVVYFFGTMSIGDDNPISLGLDDDILPDNPLGDTGQPQLILSDSAFTLDLDDSCIRLTLSDTNY